MGKPHLRKGEDLKKRAEELGVSLSYGGPGSFSGNMEPELQRRVLEAERSLRESRLWKIAVISVWASVASAFAAWFAAAK